MGLAGSAACAGAAAAVGWAVGVEAGDCARSGAARAIRAADLRRVEKLVDIIRRKYTRSVRTGEFGGCGFRLIPGGSRFGPFGRLREGVGGAACS